MRSILIVTLLGVSGLACAAEPTFELLLNKPGVVDDNWVVRKGTEILPADPGAKRPRRGHIGIQDLSEER